MSSFRSFALKGAGAALAAIILGCGPKDGVREFEQGVEAFDKGDLARAEKLLTRSMGLAPGNVDRLVLLARVKLALGELMAAGELIGRAAELRPSDSDVILLGAQIAWHAKDYRKAATDFTALANDGRLEAKVRAEGFAGLGVVEMTCNNVHLARIAFLRALRLDRRNASAWYHLGLLYRDGFGYLEAALEHLEIFVRLEPEANLRVQKVQRTVIPALKEQMAQIAASRPGVSRRNSAASATAIAKAEAAWKKGAYIAARQAYQAAFAADPLSYPAALGLARAQAKTDATKAGQTKAFESYKAACIIRPSAISTFLTTGALAAKLGLSSQAAEIYSRALAASPTSFDAIDGLIRALRKVNKTKVAQAYQGYRDSIAVKRK